MLKITAPFTEKEEVIPLVEAGADELYCGYVSPEWVERYTDFEFERKGGGSNFTDLEALKEAVHLAHGRGVPVFLTLNGLYVKHQYPLLLKIVDELNRIDLDAYIVADLGLLLTLRERGFKKQIHISTGGTVFNSEAVSFYKELGASRIILDRQLTLRSIRELSETHPDIDFEVFILDTLCVYIDGFCTFMHFYSTQTAEEISQKNGRNDEKFLIVSAYEPEAQPDACCIKYSVETFDSTSNKKIHANENKPTFYKELVDGKECGACTIYDIMHTGVRSLKIVGRQLTPEVRLQSTRFVRACLDILEDNKAIDREDFISGVQELYRKTFSYKRRCRGNNCYHPSVLYQTREHPL